MKTTRFITQTAVIAAMYAALTILLTFASSGLLQVRVAEALTVLPMFTPAAIPGLFIGCIVANIFAGNGAIDVVFGSLATLVAAFLSYKMPKRWLVPLPPVIINAVVVGFVLNYVLDAPLPVAMGLVALGQAIACYGLGYPLILLLEKHRNKVF